MSNLLRFSSEEENSVFSPLAGETGVRGRV
jgi:hypothetical protein